MESLPKDILYILALDLNINDISTYCQLSKKFNDTVCNNYNFWYNKLKKDYGFIYNGNQTLNDIKLYYRKIKNMTLFEKFCEAAFLNNKDVVEYLSLRGVNWNYGLNCAAKGGHKDMIDLMIENGADDWNWGMYGAIEGGYDELVKFFVSKGADDWEEGLSLAMFNGNRELVEFFISKGADEWIIEEEVERMYPELIRYLIEETDVDIIPQY